MREKRRKGTLLKLHAIKALHPSEPSIDGNSRVAVFPQGPSSVEDAEIARPIETKKEISNRERREGNHRVIETFGLEGSFKYHLIQ